MGFSYKKYDDHCLDLMKNIVNDSPFVKCLGKNVAKNSWPDLTSLKKDFIPLEFEEKEVEIY